MGTVVYLLFFQFFNARVGGLIRVLMFMCVLTSLYFLLTDRPGLLRADGEWLTCFCSWCWHSRSKVFFGEDRAAEERAACAHYQQESGQRVVVGVSYAQ